MYVMHVFNASYILNHVFFYIKINQTPFPKTLLFLGIIFQNILPTAKLQISRSNERVGKDMLKFFQKPQPTVINYHEKKVLNCQPRRAKSQFMQIIMRVDCESKISNVHFMNDHLIREEYGDQALNG